MKFRITNCWLDDSIPKYRQLLIDAGYKVGNIYKYDYELCFDIDLQSAEQVANIVKVVKEEIIVSTGNKDGFEITIYDDYIE